MSPHSGVKMDELRNDLIRGAARIGEEINRTPRQTYRLLENGALPAFKEAGTWTTKKSTLVRHYEKLESDK